MTSIGYGAFEYCDSLTSVVIPDSVTSIVIGDSVTNIGNYAFHNCDSLTSVYYMGTESEWDGISIDSSNYDLTEATRYYYSEETPTEEGNYWHYDASGKVVVWGAE